MLKHLVIGLLVVGLAGPLPAQTNTPARHHHGGSATSTFNLAVPAHDYDLILTRPEKDSVTLSVLAYRDLEGYVSFGTETGAGIHQTAVRRFQSGEPAELVVSPLQADTLYHYQFHTRPPGTAAFTNSPDYTFHTARPPGSAFSFTLTADAHLDEHTSPEVYGQTLANIRAGRPDFHLDLGNLFMTDKHPSREEAARQYLAQRFYLGQIGCTVPVLLALGTHDGECGRDDDGTTNSLVIWANRLRERYYPNPLPDGFYSGDTLPRPGGGLLQNYYAWQWGDALFVVLDPFTYSARQRSGGDGWGWTLGREQYDWLQRTLERSPAKFKFVFVHNLLCGDPTARGGVEVAGFNEWGGKNADGSEGFAQHRPGWAMPVHQLLVRNHVAAVFKAHDNFYARQELDGILYLMVPQPSFAGNDRIRDLQNYGYKQGVFLGNSGHVRVTVTAQQAKVEYLKASPDMKVADTCTVFGR
jgi:hypothetical protein